MIVQSRKPAMIRLAPTPRMPPHAPSPCPRLKRDLHHANLSYK